MAFPFLPFFGAVGLGSGLLEGIFGNQAIEQQGRAQRAAEEIRATQRKAESADRTARNIGSLLAGSGDRNTLGRSSKAIVIDQLSQGAKDVENIETDLDFRVMEIEQAVNRNKVDLISQSIRGLNTGLSFGNNLNSFFGGSND